MTGLWLLTSLLALGIGLVVGGAFAAFGLRARVRGATSGPHERLVRQALLRAARGKDAGVVESLTQAHQLDSSDRPSSLLLAQKLLTLGDLSRAQRVLDVMLTAPDLSADERSTAHLLRGRVLEAAQRPEEAIAAYEEAHRADPGSADALLAEGQLLSRLRRWSEAIETTNRLEKLQAERARRIRARRRVLYARELLAEGNAVEAHRQAELALEEGSVSGAAKLTLGDALFQQRRRADAASTWAAAARAEPALAPLVLERLDQLDEAARQLGARLAEDLWTAGHQKDWRLCAWLCDEALDRRDTGAASRWFQRTSQLAPNTASVQRLAARVARATEGSALSGPSQQLHERWRHDGVWIDPWRCSRCSAEVQEFEWRCPRCHAWGSFL